MRRDAFITRIYIEMEKAKRDALEHKKEASEMLTKMNSCKVEDWEQKRIYEGEHAFHLRMYGEYIGRYEAYKDTIKIFVDVE